MRPCAFMILQICCGVGGQLPRRKSDKTEKMAVTKVNKRIQVGSLRPSDTPVVAI